jgi:hypothetical protein
MFHRNYKPYFVYSFFCQQILAIVNNQIGSFFFFFFFLHVIIQFFPSFFFVCVVLEFEIRGLTFAKQVLYHLGYFSSSVLGIFRTGFLKLFVQAGFKWQSSWSLPLELGLWVRATSTWLSTISWKGCLFLLEWSWNPCQKILWHIFITINEISIYYWYIIYQVSDLFEIFSPNLWLAFLFLNDASSRVQF